MFYVYVLLTVLSVLMEYEFWTGMGFLRLPYFQMIQNPSLVVGVAHMVALKWFLPLGIIGLLLGIFGICKLHKDEGSNSLGISMCVFYAIIFFIGIL